MSTEKRKYVQLTDQDVQTIRHDYQKGALQVELASRYGVAQAHISLIVNQKSRKNA